MKKIIKIGLILLSVMCIVTKVYAASCTINFQTAKNEFEKKEDFVVDVNLSKIEAEKGIIALTAILEYDKNNLTLVGMEGQNSWSTPQKTLSYNEENGKIVMDRGGLATTDEVILKITFRVNETASGNASITLKNILTSNGIEDITAADVTKTITIKEGKEPPKPKPDPDPDPLPDPDVPSNPITPDNGNNNNNGGNDNSNPSGTTDSGTSTNGNKNIVANTSKNEKDSTRKGILPKTGMTFNIVLIFIGIALVFVVIFYTKMKRIDKKIKKKTNKK